MRLWHPADKSAGIFTSYQLEANADVTASGAWTRQMLRRFIETYVAMGDLQQELQRTLLPYGRHRSHVASMSVHSFSQGRASFDESRPSAMTAITCRQDEGFGSPG